jgi:soluble lytic murein transglycosylase-like protein
MKNKDAAITKALTELGLRDEPELTTEEEEQFLTALDPELIYLREVEELYERAALKKAALAATAAAALAGPGKMAASDQPDVQQHEKPRDEIVVTAKKPEMPKMEVDIKAPTFIERTALAKKLAKKYRVSEALVQEVVDLAYKYESPEFPKAADILAIIGVESSFNPNAKSNLRHDPALGLMQVRPGIWNIKPSDLATVEQQIKHGAQILSLYYKKLGNAEDAVHAYNIGITSFNRGRRNERYVSKYRNLVAAVGD